MEIMRETPWSRIKGQNSVGKEFLEIVGNGKPTGSALKETKKMKDKLDDEIKLAGLESLVLEEIEKHLIFNSIRMRAFEDARLEVVTYVEVKFGLRNRDSKLSETGARGHVVPMDVGAINSLVAGTRKGNRVIKSTR